MNPKYHTNHILKSLIILLLFVSCNSKYTYIYKVEDVNNDCYYHSFTNYFSIIKSKKNHYLITSDSLLLNNPFIIYKDKNSDLFYKLDSNSSIYANKELLYSHKDTITTIDIFDENKIPLTSDINRFYLKDTLIQLNGCVYNTMKFKSLAAKPTLVGGHYQLEMIDYVDKDILLPVRRDYYLYSLSGKLKNDESFSILLIKIIKH